MSTALLTCICGAKCRITLGPHKSRCGKCKRVFGPRDLARAVPEGPPVRTWGPTGGSGDEFELEREADYVFECKDESCGWSGYAFDCEEDAMGDLKCGDCGGPVRKVKDE